MSAIGLDVFGKTLQNTHTWPAELMQDEVVGSDQQVAWHVLGLVLRGIRDRIPLSLAAHIGPQLPLLVMPNLDPGPMAHHAALIPPKRMSKMSATLFRDAARRNAEA